jgi:uncharacterized membrane protein
LEAKNKLKAMTKEEYLELCSKNWEALQAATSKKNLYDLEKDFRVTWEDLGREVLEKQLGNLPNDHRKKKLEQ